LEVCKVDVIDEERVQNVLWCEHEDFINTAKWRQCKFFIS